MKKLGGVIWLKVKTKFNWYQWQMTEIELNDIESESEQKKFKSKLLTSSNPVSSVFYSWQASASVTSLRSSLSLSPCVRDCLRISGFWISSWLCAPFCLPGPGQAQSTFRKDPVRRQTSQTINVKRDFCKNTHSERYSGDMGAKHSKRRGLSKDDLEYLLGQLFPFQRIVYLVRWLFKYFSENTNYSIETIMAWYRGFKEDCPDGRLTPKAFMHVYGSSFLSANTKEFCDYVFRNFDKDGNGYIDFKEFLLAIHVTSCGSPEDKLGWAFRWGVGEELLFEFIWLRFVKTQIRWSQLCCTYELCMDSISRRNCDLFSKSSYLYLEYMYVNTLESSHMLLW